MLSLISCRSGIFRRRECRSTNKTELCLDYWTQLAHKKTTRKLRKSQEHLATISFLLVPLALNSYVIRKVMAGVGALLAKEPLPHSGAQSASR